MRGQIVKLSCVGEPEREEMFALHKSYFSNDNRETFMKEMSEKDWVIILKDAADKNNNNEKIFGFSTIQLIEAAPEHRDVLFVFSGDTIVDRDYWQANMLAPMFGHFMIRMLNDYEGLPLYWYLICKGYRTYRFLPIYFRKYYPVYNAETPPEYSRLLNFISARKFGESYDPRSGLIRFNGAKDRLNTEMCLIPESKKRNPHIKFFLEKNPYYYRGDELACLSEISKDNFNRLVYRVTEGKSVEWIDA